MSLTSNEGAQLHVYSSIVKLGKLVHTIISIKENGPTNHPTYKAD